MPARALRVAGVTGTNGKTTTTQLLAAILEAAGVSTGIIGTLGARLGDERWPLENTTPLALELQALLAAMRERGARAVAMEVSSHALAQGRVADVPFAVAALTNLTRDHLDFHGDMETYAAAKRSLFAQTAHAVLNVDDAYGARWAAELRAGGVPVTTYGFSEGAELRATDIAMRADGSTFSLDGLAFVTRLPGRFNIENALAAIAVARVLGAGDAQSARALAAFERVPGRMEHFGRGGVEVLVDYAHTPDALERVLRATRETVHGELAVVFGCGGDRDRGKRPEMGRIATHFADRVYVTSDNPRSEDPEVIVDEILAGIADRARVYVELDRGLAIARAVAAARPGDVVVVAGKGHETYQVVAAVTHRFDDREEVRRALALRDEARA
jgi:UDP-N-acetylmuramoyl-L-alanyl-D-glutamate--2,6-diaminopimelate ligase